jgi:hypothetical protein
MDLTRVDCNPEIWLQFCSTAVDPSLTSWPKYYVWTLNCFFITHTFIFQFLHYGFTSRFEAHYVIPCAVAQLGVCTSTVQTTRVRVLCIFYSSLFFIFWHHVYNGFWCHAFIHNQFQAPIYRNIMRCAWYAVKLMTPWSCLQHKRSCIPGRSRNSKMRVHRENSR